MLPRGHLMYFHLGRRRIGQDGGMLTQVLDPSFCSLRGILGWGSSQPIPGKPAVKVSCGARARRRYSPLGPERPGSVSSGTLPPPLLLLCAVSGVMTQWDEQISSACSFVSRICDEVIKKHPEYAAMLEN